MTTCRLTGQAACDLLRTRTRRDAQQIDAATLRHFVVERARSTEIGGRITEPNRVVSLPR